jgi:hypothetical protein
MTTSLKLIVAGAIAAGTLFAAGSASALGFCWMKAVPAKEGVNWYIHKIINFPSSAPANCDPFRSVKVAVPTHTQSKTGKKIIYRCVDFAYNRNHDSEAFQALPSEPSFTVFKFAGKKCTGKYFGKTLVRRS